MDASHPMAWLAAASHHIPVRKTTGARAAHYEQDQDPRLVLAATAAMAEDDEEERVEPPARASADYNTNSFWVNDHIACEDISDIYHSNAEYFRKLEELKTAHMKTMAKLRRMYQDKLNLKEVHPIIINEDSPSISSSSSSGKTSYHPVLVMTSLSEPDLSWSPSLYTSSSEEELPKLEKELSKKTKTTYAKELINNMWKDFSVEDYLKCDDSDNPVVEKTKKKPKEWVPTITVPEPFQMTIREQKKKEEAKKAMSDIGIMSKLIKEQDDDCECKKKFQANPLPLHVLLPRYQEMVKQNEERRRIMKEKNKEALLALQKPFKFIAREEQKRAGREKQLRDLVTSKKKKSRFKARPMPQSVYGYTLPTSDKLKEEDLYRNLRTQLRAQEFLQAFSTLPCGSTGRRFRNLKNCEQARKLKCKPRGRRQVPDADDSPLKYKEFSELRSPEFSTIYKRFDLQRSSSDSVKRDKILADIRADEENLKETRWPYLSPRCNSPEKNAKTPLYTFSPTKHTVSSRGREQATRRSLEEKKMLEEERNRILTKQKQRMKELQKLLTTRVKAYDSHQSLAQMSKSKVKNLRKSEKERMKEYQQELEEREEKLKQRPLLFERVAQKNARMAAEKHYSNTLKALGLSDEFVSKKGQSGKLLEYLSNQDMKSFPEDKERFSWLTAFLDLW
ncbi:protein FAM161A isoform 2-T2 [Thomomys bottae]